MDSQHEFVVRKLSSLSMRIDSKPREGSNKYTENLSFPGYFPSSSEKMASPSKQSTENDSSFGIERASYSSSSPLCSSPPFLPSIQMKDECGDYHFRSTGSPPAFGAQFFTFPGNMSPNEDSGFLNSRPQTSGSQSDSPSTSSHALSGHFQSSRVQYTDGSHLAHCGFDFYANDLSSLEFNYPSNHKNDGVSVNSWMSNEKMSPCTPLSSGIDAESSLSISDSLEDNSALNEVSSRELTEDAAEKCTDDIDFECVSSLSFNTSFMKKGLSSHFKGKSRSFTCLSSVNNISNIQDLAKPENPYNTKRRKSMQTPHSSSPKISFFHPYSSPKTRNSKLKKSNTARDETRNSLVHSFPEEEESKNQDRVVNDRLKDRREMGEDDSILRSSYKLTTKEESKHHGLVQNEADQRPADVGIKDYELKQSWMNVWSHHSPSFPNASHLVSS